LMTTRNPEPETTALPVKREVLVLSGPNRMLTTHTSRTDLFPRPHKGLYSRIGRCRHELASVSANEHPPATFGWSGFWTAFAARCSLERR
jgi:hypothetical protein